MSYTNKYYPDYEKIYPDVKLTPAVLAVLRQSDRQMRRFEEELKAEHFEFDNEKRIARFMHGREDSYERLLEKGHLQFGSEDIDVESLVLRRESHSLPTKSNATADTGRYGIVAGNLLSGNDRATVCEKEKYSLYDNS